MANLLLGMQLVDAFTSANARFKRECEEAGVPDSGPRDILTTCLTVCIAMGIGDLQHAEDLSRRFGSRYGKFDAKVAVSDSKALARTAKDARESSWDKAHANAAEPGSHVHYGAVLEDELSKRGIDWRQLHFSQVFGS